MESKIASAIRLKTSPVAVLLTDERPEGEAHRKNPDVARSFIQSLPRVKLDARFVVFKPLDLVDAPHEAPAVIVFLANADQISALVTLANYDRPGRENVCLSSSAGCHSTVLFALDEASRQSPRAFVGMTDPAARRYLDKELLSFSVPYGRFLEMEREVEGSFLTKKEWLKLVRRIDGPAF